VSEVVASLVVLVALAAAGPPAYDGEWRQACGDPRFTDTVYVEGPSGRVTRVLGERKIEIAREGREPVTFEIAGLKNTEDLQRELELNLAGATVTTLVRRADDRAGSVQREGRDVALQLLLSGDAEFKTSSQLIYHDVCLYERAEKVAREARLGIWSRRK
jgi:endonuclease YncB( thermonuclease family)